MARIARLRDDDGLDDRRVGHGDSFARDLSLEVARFFVATALQQRGAGLCSVSLAAGRGRRVRRGLRRESRERGQAGAAAQSGAASGSPAGRRAKKEKPRRGKRGFSTGWLTAWGSGGLGGGRRARLMHISRGGGPVGSKSLSIFFASGPALPTAGNNLDFTDVYGSRRGDRPATSGPGGPSSFRQKPIGRRRGVYTQQLSNVRNRLGARVIIPLHLDAAGAAEADELPVRFDALRAGRHAEAAAQPEQRP